MMRNVLRALSRAIISLAGPRRHGIGPGLLPLLRQLHPNLQGVRRRRLKSFSVRQVPIGLMLGMDCSFDSIAEGDAPIGDFSCSSHASIMRSMVWICSLVMLCSFVRV